MTFLANILFDITDFLRSFNHDKDISIGLMVFIVFIVVFVSIFTTKANWHYVPWIFIGMLFLSVFILGYSIAVPDRGYFLPEKNLIIKRIPNEKASYIYIEDTVLKIKRMLIRPEFVNSFDSSKVEIFVDSGWNVFLGGDHYGKYLVYDRYLSWQDYKH